VDLGVETSPEPQVANLNTRTASATLASATDILKTAITTSTAVTAMSETTSLTSAVGNIKACAPHGIVASSSNAARICYTLDGSTPSCTASKMCNVGTDQATTPMPSLRATTTVKAIGCCVRGTKIDGIYSTTTSNSLSTTRNCECIISS
jgi:hypothetical protein